MTHQNPTGLDASIRYAKRILGYTNDESELWFEALYGLLSMVAFNEACREAVI